MKKQLVFPLVILAMCTLPLVAQSGPGTPHTLSALLVEVRALRVAMERAASTTPQIQLLAARLSVQNERLSRATRDADAAHQQLEKFVEEVSGVTTRMAQIEEDLTRETEPERVKQLKGEQHSLKSQLDTYPAQETRLRARDTELANQVAVEQAQWAELNRRFDEVEREVAARRPR